MWTNENRGRYDRSKLRYPSDLTDEEWALSEPLIPAGKRGGNRRTVNVREVVNGLMYVLSTGCQWRAIPKDLPPRSTVYDYFDLALEAGHVTTNPTEGVKIVEVATEGFEPWTDDDVAAYRARWPLGTRQRVAFEVLRETGLRRGDAVRVGRQHVKNGVLRLPTEKTGERVAIAVSDILAAAIEAGRSAT